MSTPAIFLLVRFRSKLSFDEVKASLMMHLARQRKREVLKAHIEDLWRQAKVEILEPGLQGLGPSR